MPSTTKVKLVVENYMLNEAQTSIDGTKRYHDNPNDPEFASSYVYLPLIGESWNADYLNVILREIKKVPMADCIGHYFYDCTYRSLNEDDSAYISPATLDADKLPMTVDITSQGVRQKLDFDSVDFEWDDAPIYAPPPGVPNLNGTKLDEDELIHKEILRNIKLYRVISNYDAFNAKVNLCIARVNNKPFLDFPVGMVLFTGATISQFYFYAFGGGTNYRSKRYRVELNFSVRMCSFFNLDPLTGKFTNPDQENDGWNFRLRKQDMIYSRQKRSISIAIGGSDDYLYGKADFDQLIKSGVGIPYP